MANQLRSFDALRLNEALLQFPPAGCYWVGFSGGADSTALLTALSELKDQSDIKFKALHVNHGLHPDCVSWQDHCARYCERLGIHFETRRVMPRGNSGSGLEAEARALRYNIVAELLGQKDVFLTGHHFDDQAETLILNLMRGSGVDGLAGMPECRPLGAGMLARPLLGFRMTSLKKYLQDRAIDWIEDPSNQERKYDRNFVRHELIPYLETRWPEASDQLVNSARLCREASTVLGDWAESRLNSLLCHPQVLDLRKVHDRAAEFRLLVRQWLRMNQATPMPTKRLLELCNQVSHASTESRLCVMWGGWAIRHYQNCLWLHELGSPSACEEISWSTAQPLNLSNGSGSLRFSPSVNAPRENLVVRQPQSGDRMLVKPGSCHRKVKDLLRECGIPAWLRSSVPLLIGKDGVLAMGDLIIGPLLQEGQEYQQSRLSWQPEDSLLRFCRDRVMCRAVDPGRALR